MDRGPAPRAERRRLTHVDRSGRPRMVDVSAKPPTARRAVAEAFVALAPETLSLVIDGGGAKGDVMGVAELAGVMGGKRASELIPLCHPLALTDLVVAVTPDRAAGRACGSGPRRPRPARPVSRWKRSRQHPWPRSPSTTWSRAWSGVLRSGLSGSSRRPAGRAANGAAMRTRCPERPPARRPGERAAGRDPPEGLTGGGPGSGAAAARDTRPGPHGQ